MRLGFRVQIVRLLVGIQSLAGMSFLPEAQAYRSTDISRSQASQAKFNPFYLPYFPYGASSDELKGNIAKEENPLDNTRPDLNWPPLPRDILDRARIYTLDLDAALGLRFSPQLFGLGSIITNKKVWKMKVQVRSAFLYITSRQYNKQNKMEKEKKRENPNEFRPVDPNGPDLLKLQALALEGRISGVGTKPEKENAESVKDMGRLRIKKNEQQVAVCTHEVSFIAESGQHHSVDVMGSATSVTRTKSDTLTKTFFSQFFQLRAKSESTSNEKESYSLSQFTADEYLDNCVKTFSDQIHEQLAKEFYPLVLSTKFFHNPKSRCEPVVGDRSVDGDPSCKYAMDKIRQPFLQSKAVARCEYQDDGTHQCKMRSRFEGTACPIYFSLEKNQFADYPAGGDYVLATDRGLAPGEVLLPCDAANDMRCEFVQMPIFFGNGKIKIQGQARCQRKNDHRELLRFLRQ